MVICTIGLFLFWVALSAPIMALGIACLFIGKVSVIRNQAERQRKRRKAEIEI